ncbi:hypothetical protein [Vibrio astriarenae]|uniref:hypothetical protein n=1 Tax=Vibrio astriarenae TaxID=1481923 RepID=UPI003736A224
MTIEKAIYAAVMDGQIMAIEHLISIYKSVGEKGEGMQATITLEDLLKQLRLSKLYIHDETEHLIKQRAGIKP